MTITINHRFTDAALFTSNTAINLAGAVKEAIASGANLSGADLSYANLSGMRLQGVDLCGANLFFANLSSANLSYATLSYANLFGANLSHANLSYATLSYANLSSANLFFANLSSADLSYANLFEVTLSDAKNVELVIARTRILPEGSLIGWKKLLGGVICKMRIPEEARRSHTFGRKCRAEFVDVIEGEGISQHDGVTKYAPGLRVTADNWDENWQEEYAGGIHFYITREEAEAH